MHTDVEIDTAADTLTIQPWPDAVIDALGHDPRSWYVEKYWLGILGPSTTWLLRRLAAGLEAEPEGYQLPLAETARSLGLGDRGGRNSPFVRALTRCVQFDLAQVHDQRALAVRRMVPPLNRRQLVRLPAALQEAHQRWQEAQLHAPAATDMRRRASQLALSLFELGEDAEATERQLLRWRFDPVLAREVTRWAQRHHQQRVAERSVTMAGSAPGSGPDAA